MSESPQSTIRLMLPLILQVAPVIFDVVVAPSASAPGHSRRNLTDISRIFRGAKREPGAHGVPSSVGAPRIAMSPSIRDRSVQVGPRMNDTRPMNGRFSRPSSAIDGDSYLEWVSRSWNVCPNDTPNSRATCENLSTPSGKLTCRRQSRPDRVSRARTHIVFGEIGHVFDWRLAERPARASWCAATRA